MFSVHLCPQAYFLVSSFGGLSGLSRLPFFRERETPPGCSGSWCQAPPCCSGPPGTQERAAHGGTVQAARPRADVTRGARGDTRKQLGFCEAAGTHCCSGLPKVYLLG